MDAFIGFDSAWTDNARAPGAICAVIFDSERVAHVELPRLVSFAEAATFITQLKARSAFTLVALDQPTIVKNATGMRPVERVAASLVSWLGGGVQPSNRGRLGMFCDASPIWRFIAELGAAEEPEGAREATEGLYLIEVFPALALPSLDPDFFGRLRAPKYNPGRRKTFRAGDWKRVAMIAEQDARAFGCEPLALWCHETAKITQPRKADQDMLDSVVCLLVALRWRRRPRMESLVLGDLSTGYMVLPASTDVRERLTARARELGVPIK